MCKVLWSQSVSGSGRLGIASFRSTLFKQKEDAKRYVEDHLFSGKLVWTLSWPPSGFSRRAPASQFQVAQKVITTQHELFLTPGESLPGVQPWGFLPRPKWFSPLLRSGISLLEETEQPSQQWTPQGVWAFKDSRESGFRDVPLEGGEVIPEKREMEKNLKYMAILPWTIGPWP